MIKKKKEQEEERKYALPLKRKRKDTLLLKQEREDTLLLNFIQTNCREQMIYQNTEFSCAYIYQ